jgi:hypothetical protein
MKDLESAGASLLHEDKGSGAYMSAMWILPAAITVFIAERYFGALIAEAAKGHYPTLAKALGRLWGRLVRREVVPPTEFAGVVNGRIVRYFNGPILDVVFSARMKYCSIRFLIEDSVPEALHDNALAQMLELVKGHVEERRSDPVAQYIRDQGYSPTRDPVQMTLVYDIDLGAWRVVDQARDEVRLANPRSPSSKESLRPVAPSPKSSRSSRPRRRRGRAP